MLCGGGENILLFTKYVKEGRITLEQAVHVMTGKLADHFHLHDRGVLAAGKRADIVVFSLDEIGYRRMEKRHDVPDGKGGTTWRFTRPPAPMRLTLVNGEPTFENGAFTQAFPGQMLSPAPASHAAARTAPRAKAMRLEALCVISMRSPSAAKSTV